jgi:hypothetical protein
MTIFITVVFIEVWQINKAVVFILFILLDLPTRAGSPQQHKPITVGPFYLTHPVNFPCGRKPEYPGNGKPISPNRRCYIIDEIKFKGGNKDTDIFMGSFVDLYSE